MDRRNSFARIGDIVKLEADIQGHDGLRKARSSSTLLHGAHGWPAVLKVPCLYVTVFGEPLLSVYSEFSVDVTPKIVLEMWLVFSFSFL